VLRQFVLYILFRDRVLDTASRQRRLECRIYVYTQLYEKRLHVIDVVRKIAEETGVLVSPRFICCLRKDAEKTTVSL
jgi:hypothetical protein